MKKLNIIIDVIIVSLTLYLTLTISINWWFKLATSYPNILLSIGIYLLGLFIRKVILPIDMRPKYSKSPRDITKYVAEFIFLSSAIASEVYIQNWYPELLGKPYTYGSLQIDSYIIFVTFLILWFVVMPLMLKNLVYKVLPKTDQTHEVYYFLGFFVLAIFTIRIFVTPGDATIQTWLNRNTTFTTFLMGSPAFFTLAFNFGVRGKELLESKFSSL